MVVSQDKESDNYSHEERISATDAEGLSSNASLNEKHGVEHFEDIGSENEVAHDTSQHSFLGFDGIKLQRMITVIAGTGFLLFGYDQGVMGSLLTLPTFYEQMPSMNTSTEELKKKNATWQGFVVAVYEIGCLAGALATMYIGDKLGRRKTIVLGCVVMIIGAIIQAASYSAGQLLVARIITGIGNGFNTSTVPIWQSECSRPEKRGQLVMTSGALISLGIAISYWVDLGFFFARPNSVSWRFPLAFQIAFPLVILPFIMSLPESPRWLLKKGKRLQAAQVFSALESVPVNDVAIAERMDDIESSLKQELRKDGTSGSGTRLLVTQGKNRNFHRAMLAVFAQVIQQISGINLITYYATMVFEDFLGMDATLSRILSGCNGTEYFLAAIIACYTVEKFGRRKLMLFGAAGQAASMAVLCGTQWAAKEREDNASAIVACVFLFIFNSFFAIGFLGMTWLLPAELTPINIRAPANGISTAANWCFNFVVVMTTPVGNEQIGPYLYAVYAVINFLMIPTIYFLYPETSGRTLEEMDEIFENCNPWKPWQAVRMSLEKPKKIEMPKDIEESHAFADN